MSIKTIRQVYIVCDECRWESSLQTGATEIEFERWALVFGWRTTTRGSPLMSESEHLCPRCARDEESR